MGLWRQAFHLLGSSTSSIPLSLCVCVLGRGCCHSNLGCLPQCSLTPKCAQAYTGHIVGEMERETWDLSVGAPV